MLRQHVQANYGGHPRGEKGHRRTDRRLRRQIEGRGDCVIQPRRRRVRDRSTKNASKLRSVFEQWTGPARKVGRVSRNKAKTAPRTTADKQQTGAIREWAKNNGYNVSSRGRIQADIIEAYNKAS
jgi:hypothetical protein